MFENLPSLFSYSLKKRIKPRVTFLETKEKEINLLSYITRSDKIFCEKYADCSLDEYNKFKEEFCK